MTERDEPYTPSLEDARESYVQGKGVLPPYYTTDHAEVCAERAMEFDRMIDAFEKRVRQEERERCEAEQEARAEAVRAQKAVWAEVHGQDPNRTYTVAEVKRLVYTLDNAISALVSRSASPATSEADECSCRGEYITALDLVDGCKCGRLKPFHEMTDEEVNVAASPVTRETVTEEMVERAARAYWQKSMEDVGIEPDDWDESEREQFMWAARIVLEAALTEGNAD